MRVSTHWLGFVSIGLYFQLFSLATVWFLPESPVYLLKRKRYGELREALETIASWNGTDLNEWDASGLSFEDCGDSVKSDNKVLKVSNLPT